ncbi:MAG: hypothetical protein CMI02_05595 [Oceanospirillaceae bacterium]|nr:hypothetical protein [Oceanospirillaceae bacterium]
MRQNKFLFMALVVVVVAVFTAGFTARSKPHYVTWRSLEPDVWASIWLIKTHIDPDAKISLLPPGSEITSGIAFGVPESRYRRDRQSSAFEKLLSRLKTDNPDLSRMGALITSLESLSWSATEDPLPPVVEAVYRRLQERFDRDYVPATCYGQFFSEVYGGVAERATPDAMMAALSEFLEQAESDCQWEGAYAGGGMLDSRHGQIDLLPVESVLEAIDTGKKVVFVDTRETGEYDAGHIPGAINLKLRDVDKMTAAPLMNADIVVSYCLKDFRGYEVARKLKQYGVSGAVTMSPHGLVGWHALGLPTATAKNEELAAQALTACAGNVDGCMKKKEAP